MASLLLLLVLLLLLLLLLLFLILPISVLGRRKKKETPNFAACNNLNFSFSCSNGEDTQSRDSCLLSVVFSRYFVELSQLLLLSRFSVCLCFFLLELFLALKSYDFSLFLIFSFSFSPSYLSRLQSLKEGEGCGCRIKERRGMVVKKSFHQ